MKKDNSDHEPEKKDRVEQSSNEENRVSSYPYLFQPAINATDQEIYLSGNTKDLNQLQPDLLNALSSGQNRLPESIVTSLSETYTSLEKSPSPTVNRPFESRPTFNVTKTKYFVNVSGSPQADDRQERNAQEKQPNPSATKRAMQTTPPSTPTSIQSSVVSGRLHNSSIVLTDSPVIGSQYQDHRQTHHHHYYYSSGEKSPTVFSSDAGVSGVPREKKAPVDSPSNLQTSMIKADPTVCKLDVREEQIKKRYLNRCPRPDINTFFQQNLDEKFLITSPVKETEKVANVDKVKLEHLDLSESNFSYAFFKQSSFKGSTLTNVKFHGTYLEGANFTNAQGLRSHQLKKACFEGVVVDAADQQNNRERIHRAVKKRKKILWQAQQDFLQFFNSYSRDQKTDFKEVFKEWKAEKQRDPVVLDHFIHHFVSESGL